ncbi:MAG TPA: hypothetical protein VKP65_04955, partial [Rhodothermales bacterium]|nr:hypothetical protein [Rhodothermales bacterium]
MFKRYRFLIFMVALLFAAPLSIHAQNLADDREAPRYTTERKLIKTTLETIVAIIQESTLRNEGSGLSDRLSQITSQLTHASQLMPASPDKDAMATTDLDELRRLLRQITDEMEALREE